MPTYRPQAIILGTAQFGLPYGIANQSGQLLGSRARETLRIAREGGIRMLDTATAYGESESTLGKLGVGDLQLQTKLDLLPSDCRDIRSWVRQQIECSLRRLGVDRIHNLLFHRPGQLLEAKGLELYDAARAAQHAGLAEKIGVSVYQPDELERLFAQYTFDVVQAPLSPLDRRLVSSGWLERLRGLDCEVQARSVFLQGLLLMPASDRPPYFRRWDSVFAQWDSWLVECALEPLQACLGYVLSVPGIAGVVVGVDGPEQLQEVLAVSMGQTFPDPAKPFSDDPGLLNPSGWPRA